MFIPDPSTHWKSIYDNVFMIMNTNTHEFKGNFNITKEQSHVFPFYHISNIQMAYQHWHFSFYGWDLHPCKCCHCWFDSCKPFLPRNLYSWFCNAKNNPNGITKLQLHQHLKNKLLPPRIYFFQVVCINKFMIFFTLVANNICMGYEKPMKSPFNPNFFFRKHVSITFQCKPF